MARTLRQSKILELISTKEIETQDDLVANLKNAGFEVTQATISRDIKELGLIKVIDSVGKYKYALVDSGEQGVSNKNINLFKMCVISVKALNNICVIRTVKQFASGVCSLIDKLNLIDIIGATCGDDSVMVYFTDSLSANNAVNTLLEILE
ncbi:MAG: arginine repressor [Clostridia bacterium]|nr:arginine repressor [Clostridia bacterium]